MTGPKQTAGPGPDPDLLELAPGKQRESLEGLIPPVASEPELREALEKAFDYRGDVTLTLKDGTRIEGYLFDRLSGPTTQSSFVRVLPANSTERRKIAYDQIAALAFTGRDTAAGKSWEAWVNKYWEKKATAGEKWSLEPESRD